MSWRVDRDLLALAHHRFYCHDSKCTDVSEVDYDFADFVLEQAEESAS